MERKWAIQDSNLCNENATDSIKNAENDSVAFEGVSKSASLVDRSEQMLQLLALLQGLSSEELEALLKLASELNNGKTTGEIS